MTTGIAKLELAESHLQRVLLACDPPDWAALSIFGFHALENAVDAACLHLSVSLQSTHPRVAAARQLHKEHGCDDVSEWLHDLNETRKNKSYGDVPAPELDAQETAAQIESYVKAGRKFLER